LVIIETPKRHLLGGNRTYMPILVEIGSLVRPVRSDSLHVHTALLTLLSLRKAARVQLLTATIHR